MRLIIKLSAFNNQEVRLPIHYNHLLQAVIYGSLDGEFAQFLHDRGYEGGGRRFKLFTFSRLIGEYHLLGQEITFRSQLKLVVASPVDHFCQHLLNGLFSKSELWIGQALLLVDSVNVEAPKIGEDHLKLRLLSPVVAYSTLLKPEGKPYTCYYQPGEHDFARVAAENLRKKYRAIYDRDPPGRRYSHSTYKTAATARFGV